MEPFSLCNSKSRIRVSVHNPLTAHDHKLSTIYDTYESVSDKAADKMLGFLTGYQVIGIQTVEKMLLPDTKLTAIGQAVLHDGQIQIEAPKGGMKYFLTRNSIDSLIESEESRAFVWKVVSIIFLGIGGILCCVWLRNYYKKYFAELEYQRLQTENYFTDDERSCVVCFTNPKDIVLIPCGHVCACKYCLEQVTNCPICRKAIDRKIPIFL